MSFRVLFCAGAGSASSARSKGIFLGASSAAAVRLLPQTVQNLVPGRLAEPQLGQTGASCVSVGADGSASTVVSGSAVPCSSHAPQTMQNSISGSTGFPHWGQVAGALASAFSGAPPLSSVPQYMQWENPGSAAFPQVGQTSPAGAVCAPSPVKSAPHFLQTVQPFFTFAPQLGQRGFAFFSFFFGSGAFSTSSTAGAAVPSTGVPHFLQKIQPSLSWVPQTAQVPITFGSAAPICCPQLGQNFIPSGTSSPQLGQQTAGAAVVAAAASVSGSTSVFSLRTSSRPHCLQKREPGFCATTPQCGQTPMDSGALLSTTGSTFCPHCLQKRVPSLISAPQDLHIATVNPPFIREFFPSVPHPEGMDFGQTNELPHLRLFNHGQYRTNRRESLTRDFSVRKRCKTAGILCVFQGFTNAFLAKNIRQNPKTHLCGVTPNSHPRRPQGCRDR